MNELEKQVYIDCITTTYPNYKLDSWTDEEIEMFYKSISFANSCLKHKELLQVSDRLRVLVTTKENIPSVYWCKTIHVNKKNDKVNTLHRVSTRYLDQYFKDLEEILIRLRNKGLWYSCRVLPKDESFEGTEYWNPMGVSEFCPLYNDWIKDIN